MRAFDRINNLYTKHNISIWDKLIPGIPWATVYWMSGQTTLHHRLFAHHIHMDMDIDREASNQILSLQYHNWYSWYRLCRRRCHHYYCCYSCCLRLEYHINAWWYPFWSVRVCCGLLSHAWTRSPDSTPAMIFNVERREALYMIQIDIPVNSLCEGISSIDLFAQYFHFNVIPCCVQLLLRFREHFELTAMKWLYHVWYISVVNPCPKWNFYYDISIACVVNKFAGQCSITFSWNLIEIWDRFELTICGRNLIYYQHSTFHANWARLIWATTILCFTAFCRCLF